MSSAGTPSTQNIKPTPPENYSPLPVVPPYEALHNNIPSPCLSTHMRHFLVCMRATTFLGKIYEGETEAQRRAELAMRRDIMGDEVEDIETSMNIANLDSCQRYWKRFIRCSQAKNGDVKAREWLLKQERGIVDLRSNNIWTYKRDYVNALRRSGRLLKGGAQGVEEDLETYESRMRAQQRL